MSLRLITPPAAEPVTLAEAKAFLRVDVTDEDTYISSLITTARRWIERVTDHALVTQSWEYSLDDWPRTRGNGWWNGVRQGPVTGTARRSLNLPRPPLQSVTSVTVYDDSDQGILFDAANYYVDTSRRPGRLVLRAGKVWPAVGRAANGIEIRFTAGYGAAGSDVPGEIRQAVYLLVAHWFERREPVTDQGVPATSPHSVAALLAPYGKVRL